MNQQLSLHLLCKGLVYNHTLSHGHPAANSRYSVSFLQAVGHCIIYACQLMRLHNCTIAPRNAPSAIIWNSPFWLPRKPRTRAHPQACGASCSPSLRAFHLLGKTSIKVKWLACTMDYKGKLPSNSNSFQSSQLRLLKFMTAEYMAIEST